MLQLPLLLSNSPRTILTAALHIFTMTSTRRAVHSLSTTASNKNNKQLNLHWFRHTDLRLHDNPALHKAATTSSSSGIVPVFCFDPSLFGSDATTPFGSVKIGPRRAQFILDGVADLRTNLEGKGSGLYVAYGAPDKVFDGLCTNILTSDKRTTPVVFCQEEVCSEETKDEARVRRVLKSHNSGELTRVWGGTMYDPETLPFNGGVEGIPDTFTPFRNNVEKNCDIGAPLSCPPRNELALPPSFVLDAAKDGGFTYLPTLSDLGYDSSSVSLAETHDTRSVMKFHGGETAALARVKEYIWTKDLLKSYFDTRNGMLGGDYSTKFAPWLAHGNLSPRLVAQECSRYERERVANKSTYWVVFELLWRDYFKFFSKKHGDDIFKLDGTLGRAAQGEHPNSRKWSFSRKEFAAWKEGRTGYPLVDANMRELACSGFMSNRGRQNVCSFLTIDMKTDWRYGADYFESELLDYDVHSNWGNWCSGAGMTGGRLNRFNIVKQGKDYDPLGKYVKCWCPELEDVPVQFIHEPWKMSAAVQEECGVKIGRDYPVPIIEPTVPSKDFRNKKGGKGGARGKGKNNNNNGGNRNYGEVKQMKSLPKGSYRIK